VPRVTATPGMHTLSALMLRYASGHIGAHVKHSVSIQWFFGAGVVLILAGDAGYLFSKLKV